MDTHLGLTGGPIYLDYNATTPIDPRGVDAMLPYLRIHFGNPSSSHRYGTAPNDAIAQRRQVAQLVGARPEEIVFTGSGSEATNLAIRGTVLAQAGHTSSGPRTWSPSRPSTPPCWPPATPCTGYAACGIRRRRGRASGRGRRRSGTPPSAQDPVAGVPARR